MASATLTPQGSSERSNNEGQADPTVIGSELRAGFVKAMRAVPGAVAIVATDMGGDRRGLAATAWTSLTADPPMLLVCVNRTASAHPFIVNRGAFSINLLTARASETVATFSGQRGLSGEARFASGAWSVGPGGQPLFDDALAAFECELADQHEYGTHTILIGRVTHVASADTGLALLYANGAYACAGPLSEGDDD